MTVSQRIPATVRSTIGLTVAICSAAAGFALVMIYPPLAILFGLVSVAGFIVAERADRRGGDDR